MCIFTDYARNGVIKAKIRKKLRKIVMVGTSAKTHTFNLTTKS